MKRTAVILAVVAAVIVTVAVTVNAPAVPTVSEPAGPQLIARAECDTCTVTAAEQAAEEIARILAEYNCRLDPGSIINSETGQLQPIIFVVERAPWVTWEPSRGEQP